MREDIPVYDIEHPPLHESPTSKLELIQFRSPLSNGGKRAVRKTFTSTDFDLAVSEIDVQRQLSDFPDYFPQLYFHRRKPTVLLIMEYCQMGDLAQFLREKRSPWDINQLHMVMWHLVNALHKMHSLGISHGDIKPHNVFISAEGVCKLGDFGHAIKHSYPAKDRPMSIIDFDSDVYSLGKTFLECFAVEVGVDLEGKSGDEVEYIIEQGTRDYPSVYQNLIKDMMKTDRLKRITISEVFEALGSIPMEAPNARLSLYSTESVVREADRNNIRRVPQERFQRYSSSGEIIETQEMKVTRPIRVSARLNRGSQPRPAPSSDQRFAVLAGQLETIVKLQNSDERLLRATLESMVAEHKRLRGKIVVKLSAELRTCSKCNVPQLFSKSAELHPCKHILCTDCLNATITNVLHSDDRRLAAIVCPTCHLPFDSLHASVTALLTVYVLRDLDEMCLLETHIKCPKCSITIDYDSRSGCRSIKCLCKHSFCSYCRKPSHSAGCTKWEQDHKKS